MEGGGFRGGSYDKMRKMWLGLEIVVVGLPPLPGQFYDNCLINHACKEKDLRLNNITYLKKTTRLSSLVGPTVLCKSEVLESCIKF